MIHVSNLTKYYGDYPAVRGVSFEVARGQVAGFLGPNGAGNSTTAKSVVRDRLGILHYVNADTLARGLSEFDSESMAMKAGKVMVEHLHDLARQCVRNVKRGAVVG